MSGDFIHGEMDSLAIGIAMRSKISQHQAYNIITKIGFYEERYGPKPMIIEKIVELSNYGCSPERIFAAIKLIPGKVDKEKASSLSVDIIDSADKVLSGEDKAPKSFAIMKRAVDI